MCKVDYLFYYQQLLTKQRKYIKTDKQKKLIPVTVFQRYKVGLLMNPSGKNKHPIIADATIAKPKALEQVKMYFLLDCTKSSEEVFAVKNKNNRIAGKKSMLLEYLKFLYWSINYLSWLILQHNQSVLDQVQLSKLFQNRLKVLVRILIIDRISQMQPKYLIGTLFEQEEQNKKMNIHNMKNKDPMGNTRWKGAFTGGFQAGFKNTCGSKQGWEPAQFISSIYKRAEKTQQNIHQFMDKQDLGRQSLQSNISLTNNFLSSQKNPFNISLQESIGAKIYQKLKKSDAAKNIPQNQEDLKQLMKIYQKQQTLMISNTKYELKDLQNPYSVGAQSYDVQDDEFVEGFQQLYKKVIRADIKQESQQQLQKRREQNKIYFDFSKPLQEQPQYLKQIQQIELISQPKKRRKNILNILNLKAIFKQSSPYKEYQAESIIKQVPEDYDPYHRIRKLTDQTLQKTSLVQKQVPKHRIHSIQQRSDIFGSEKLSSKFVSASNLQNRFMKSDETKILQLKKIFQDQQKNKRYQDYVDQLQGRKIVAQLQFKSFEQIQKQKKQFDAIYKLDKLKTTQQKKLPSNLQMALSNQKTQALITRQISLWRPQKALCKRFGVLAPYKIQNQKHQKYQKYQRHQKHQKRRQRY